MAALDFPATPSNGQLYTANGHTWMYDSTSTTWLGQGNTINITDDTTTNATMYPLWSSSSSGQVVPKISTSKLTFNPSIAGMAIGTTLAAWDVAASSGSIDIGTLGGINTNADVTVISNNAYWATSWKYKTTAAASTLWVGQGAISMYCAPSGTAGTSIGTAAAIRALTISASKNLIMSGATEATWETTSFNGNVIQIGLTTSIAEQSSGGIIGSMFLMENAVNDNTLGWMYQQSRGAALIQLISTTSGSGSILLRVAPLGTANAALSWQTGIAIKDTGHTLTYRLFGSDQEVDNGNSGTSDTIDWNAGVNQKSTLTGNVTYTFTAPTIDGTYICRLRLLQDGTGGRTVTWPTVTWAGNAAPTIETTLNRNTIVTFYITRVSGVTTYFGSAVLY